MKFTLPNNKTALSVTSAITLALALAGCSAPPQDTVPVDNSATPPAETSQVPADQDTATDASADTKSAEQASAADDSEGAKSIAWLTSYNKALEEATKKNQPVMIDFYADWCTACKLLDKDIYTAPDVIQKSQNFVNLKIDTDKDTEIAARYKVYALPTLIFLDGSGKVLWRLEGVPTTTHFINTMQKVQDKFIART